MALFVSSSVFVGAAALFTLTIVASRSWVGAEQKRILVADATGHVQLLEEAGLATEGLDRALATVHPNAHAAVAINGRWFGTAREIFGGKVSPRAEDAIVNSRLFCDADASANESLIALPIVLNGLEGRYYELADHTTWDTRRARSRRILVVSAIFLGAVAAVVGAIAGRRFSRPLTDAAVVARLVSQGGLSARLPETDDPALADLTRTFNEMVETLATRAEIDRRFNSDVSHELRSPLTTIVASLAVLQSRRHELSPANRTALDLLDADLQRFMRLVDDLLEMSRFDGGAASLVLSKVNVSEFVEAVVATADRDDLHVVISPLARVFEIDLDKRRIARVITNLIDNAYLHGRPPVSLSVVEYPPGDTTISHLRIVVEDRGPGVDLDNAEQLFERFNRGDSPLRSEGSGLGLALAREHLNLHGGTINFEPLPRGIAGTRVVFMLPLRVNDQTVGRPTTLSR